MPKKLWAGGGGASSPEPLPLFYVTDNLSYIIMRSQGAPYSFSVWTVNPENCGFESMLSNQRIQFMYHLSTKIKFFSRKRESGGKNLDLWFEVSFIPLEQSGELLYFSLVRIL